MSTISPTRRILRALIGLLSGAAAVMMLVPNWTLQFSEKYWSPIFQEDEFPFLLAEIGMLSLYVINAFWFFTNRRLAWLFLIPTLVATAWLSFYATFELFGELEIMWPVEIFLTIASALAILGVIEILWAFVRGVTNFASR